MTTNPEHNAGQLKCCRLHNKIKSVITVKLFAHFIDNDEGIGPLEASYTSPPAKRAKPNKARAGKKVYLLN